MKVIRGTIYPTTDAAGAMTQVIREPDLLGTLDEALRSLGDPVPGALIVTDVFEAAPAAGIEVVTIMAERRRQMTLQRELNMALLYHWDGDYLRHVSERGMLSGSIPAPHLREQDVRSVLQQLARHPNYRHQRVVAIARDWTMLEMHDGVVTLVEKA